MKTEEDEAFDELARKQGDWGSGFQTKRRMAADRFKDGIEWWMDTKTYGAYPNPPQWHIDTGNLVRLVPQREWVGLTDEERDAITSEVIGFNSCVGWEEDYAKAVEQLLKEKNND